MTYFVNYMVVLLFFTLVLAVRAASSPHGASVRESAYDLGTQPHYRFTRQPVKYYRHHNARTRLSVPRCATRQTTRPKRVFQESVDSSHSTSPEPETQACSQNFDGHWNNTQQPRQVTTTAKDIKEGPLSPRDVVEYMLGLDSAVTSPAAQMSSSTTQRSTQKVDTWWQDDQNINMNRHWTGQISSLNSSPKNIPFEHNLTSPAQRILSGLKLRRSHSGKEEQLFV